MNKYALVRDGIVQSIVESDSLEDFPDLIAFLVPCDEDVRCNWRHNGESFSAPVVPIADVTPRQMRQALILSGVSISTIEDALDSLSEPSKSLARIEWEYSLAFQRNRPFVLAIGQMLGWTSEQLDNLWKLAATL